MSSIAEKPPEGTGAASRAEFIPSAFKLVYLGAFIFAIFQIIYLGIQNAKNTIPKVGLSQLDGLAWQCLILIFLLAVVVHLFRIYITLERLEHEVEPFANFYSTFSNSGIWWEFVARIIVVVVVTLKALSPATGLFLDRYSAGEVRLGVYDSLPSFLCLLYGALLIWGLVVYFAGKKDVRDSFIPSSVAGLLGAITITVILPQRDGQVIIGTILLLGFSGLLCWDVMFRSGWSTYLKEPLKIFM